MAAFLYAAAYLEMRMSGAGHIGAKQFAANQVRIARRARIERKGRL